MLINFTENKNTLNFIISTEIVIPLIIRIKLIYHRNNSFGSPERNSR